MPTPSHDEIKQDLLTNPRYTALFAPYHPLAVARFADYYALEKFQWQYKGAHAEVDQTYALSRLSDAAYVRLWDIQRKKLFDLQCRWRAGEVVVPGLDCTFDLRYYDADIENCPLLDPISPDELALYGEFVAQAVDFDDEVLDCYASDGPLPRDWQDYHGLGAGRGSGTGLTADDDDEAIAPPAWYDFHNARTGNGRLLALPDVRGALERPYLDAHSDHIRAQYAAAPVAPPPADPRPRALSLAETKALQHAVLHQFETPRLRRQQAAYVRQQAREMADQQVEADFNYLKALGPDEAVPLEAAADWRAALRRAVVDIQRRQLLAHLPQVYDDYLLRQEQGIRHPAAAEPRFRNRDRYLREALLNGRELLGEPRTFDF